MTAGGPEFTRSGRLKGRAGFALKPRGGPSVDGQHGAGHATLRKMEWLFGLAKPALGARPVSAVEAPQVLQVFVASRLVTGVKPPTGFARMIRPEHCAAR